MLEHQFEEHLLVNVLRLPPLRRAHWFLRGAGEPRRSVPGGGDLRPHRGAGSRTAAPRTCAATDTPCRGHAHPRSHAARSRPRAGRAWRTLSPPRSSPSRAAPVACECASGLDKKEGQPFLLLFFDAARRRRRAHDTFSVDFSSPGTNRSRCARLLLAMLASSSKLKRGAAMIRRPLWHK